MNNSSVGDLAAQIMAQDTAQGTPAPAPTSHAGGLPANSTDPLVVESQSSLDISNVEVPDDFMNSILGGAAPAPVATPQPQPLVESVAPPVAQPLQEVNDLCILVQEVRDLLAEVRGTLVEMTAVGSLGVNMAGPGKAKEDEEEEEKDPMKAMLKRIKSRRASS
jgi:hypothetical protein